MAWRRSWEVSGIADHYENLAEEWRPGTEGARSRSGLCRQMFTLFTQLSRFPCVFDVFSRSHPVPQLISAHREGQMASG